MGHLNMFSGVGRAVVFAAVAPAYANLAVGYAYALHLINTTAAEIKAGNIAVKTAPASDDDPCVPGTWAPMEGVPVCGDSASPGDVVVDLANLPIPAGGQCAISWPCPDQFVQVDALPAGIQAVIVVTSLRRTDSTFDWVAPAFAQRASFSPLQVAAPAGSAQAQPAKTTAA